MLKSRLKFFDWKLFGYAFAIISIGMLGFHSAVKASFFDPIIQQQLIHKQYLILLLGFIAFGFFSLLNTNILKKASPIIFGLAIFLLILTLNIPGNSVKRWIQFGPISFQTSEFAKLAFILIMAKILTAKEWNFGNLKDLFLLSPILIIPFALIFKQPDLGTALTFTVIFFVMLFWEGLDWELLILLLSPLLGIILIMVFFDNYIMIGVLYSLLVLMLTLRRKHIKETLIFFGINLLNFILFPNIWQGLQTYQQNRILAFIYPSFDPMATGARYHATKSIIAIASGGLFGKGFMKGPLTHLNYIPEQHTDFIFSVIGEEWGFLVSAILIILFFLLFLRIINIIYESHTHRFNHLISVGILSLLLFQMSANLFMALGMIPVVGLPLPFISYGGSSFILCMSSLGILQSIALNQHKTIYKEKYE